MQLAGQVFNRRDDTGRRAVHRVADDCVTAVADGVQDFPTGQSLEPFHFTGYILRMSVRKYEEVRLPLRRRCMSSATDTPASGTPSTSASVFVEAMMSTTV